MDRGGVPTGNLGNALCKDAKMRDELAQAQLVIGANTRKPGKDSLFYGAQTLRRAIAQGKDLQANVAFVQVDYQTDDVKVLVAFCTTQKGSCCYNGEVISDPGSN